MAKKSKRVIKGPLPDARPCLVQAGPASRTWAGGLNLFTGQSQARTIGKTDNLRSAPWSIERQQRRPILKGSRASLTTSFARYAKFWKRITEGK